MMSMSSVSFRSCAAVVDLFRLDRLLVKLFKIDYLCGRRQSTMALAVGE